MVSYPLMKNDLRVKDGLPNAALRGMWSALLMVPFALVTMATTAMASFLAPGGSTVTPTAYGAGSLPGTFIAEMLPIPVVTQVGYSGLLDSIVMLDSGTGFLNFLYQVTNDATSGDELTQVRVSDFMGIGSAGFGNAAVDVGFIDGVSLAAAGISGAPVKPIGTNSPVSFTRTTNGTRINANFSGIGLAPGEVSSWLVVRTNATTEMVRVGLGSVVDGLQSNLVPILAPVPEPTTALFGGALGLLCVAGRRRRLAV